METNRKGLCINVGNCKNADSKLPIELSIAADFVCPECSRELIPIDNKKSAGSNKIIGISAGAVLVLLLSGGLFYYFKIKNTVKVANDLIVKVDSTAGQISGNKDAVSSTSMKTANNTEPSSASSTKPNNQGSQVTASTVEEYFTKLGDASIKDKTGLKKGMIALFASANVPVIKMNDGKPTNDGTIIGDYIEVISARNKKVTVTNKEMVDGKISKINVSED